MKDLKLTKLNRLEKNEMKQINGGRKIGYAKVAYLDKDGNEHTGRCFSWCGADEDDPRDTQAQTYAAN